MKRTSSSQSDGIAPELFLVGFMSKVSFHILGFVTFLFLISLLLQMQQQKSRLDPGKLAGSSAPQSVEHLRALADEGVGALSFSIVSLFLLLTF